MQVALQTLNITQRHSSSMQSPMDVQVQTRLCSACTDGRLSEVKLLVEGENANCSFRDPVTGETALLCAAGRNRVDVARYLISRGACIHDCDWMGWTALTVSSLSGFQEMTELLLKHTGIANVPYTCSPNPEKNKKTKISQSKHKNIASDSSGDEESDIVVQPQRKQRQRTNTKDKKGTGGVEDNGARKTRRREKACDADATVKKRRVCAKKTAV